MSKKKAIEYHDEVFEQPFAWAQLKKWFACNI